MKKGFAGRCLGALALVAVAAPLALAQMTVIPERQAAMKAQGAAMGSIGPFIRNEQPFNQQAAVSAMTTVRDSAAKIPAWFATGSGPGPGVTTRALPAIWTNKGDFDQKASGLQTAASTALLAAQAGDAAAFRTAFGGVGQACGACHTPYRAPQ